MAANTHILLGVLIATIMEFSLSLDVSCAASKTKLNFTVSGDDANNIADILLFTKTSTPRDPWVKQKNCNLLGEFNLQCPIQRENNAQNLKVDVIQKPVGNKTAKLIVQELWFYDCYEKHGIKDIKIESNKWNEFTLTWSHHNADSNFLKEDHVTIETVEDGKSGKTEKVNLDNQKNLQRFTYTKVSVGVTYKVCMWTTFFRSTGDIQANSTVTNTEKVTTQLCRNITTPERTDDESSTDLRTPLLAVGIGVLCLVLLCLLFIIYNKKCKQGGDHDYDMNKEETLMGEAQDGEELQPYTNGEKGKLNDDVNGDEQEDISTKAAEA